MLVFGRKIFAVLEIGIEQALCVSREEIHREMNTLEIAPRITTGGIKWVGCPRRHKHGVKVLLQIVRIDVLHFAAALLHDLGHVAGGEVFLFTDMRTGDKLHA